MGRRQFSQLDEAAELTFTVNSIFGSTPDASSWHPCVPRHTSWEPLIYSLQNFKIIETQALHIIYELSEIIESVIHDIICDIFNE